jgi:predicted RNase H-like nuclease
MPPDHVAVGVDATPAGWVAVRYHDHEYASVHRYADADAADSAFGALWHDHDDADALLVDVPIGLPADEPARAPEREARHVLGDRAASVFNVPIRPVLDVDDYDDANRIQRRESDKGLMRQTFNITPRIREVDRVLGATDGPAADATQHVIREAHPEVCFWALTDGTTPMRYSKTGQPAAAHWERVGVLATVHDGDAFHDALADAGRALVDWSDPQLGNDDLLDAFALAVTASPLTNALQTLPEHPARDEMGLRMEMVYATPEN